MKGHARVIVQSSKETGKNALAIFVKGLDHLSEGNLEGSSRDYDLSIEGLLVKRPHVRGI